MTSVYQMITNKLHMKAKTSHQKIHRLRIDLEIVVDE